MADCGNSISVLIREEHLKARVRQLGQQISADYAGHSLLVVGILKGVRDLSGGPGAVHRSASGFRLRCISSYGADVQSSGVVMVAKDIDAYVEGRTRPDRGGHCRYRLDRANELSLGEPRRSGRGQRKALHSSRQTQQAKGGSRHRLPWVCYRRLFRSWIRVGSERALQKSSIYRNCCLRARQIVVIGL